MKMKFTCVIGHLFKDSPPEKNQFYSDSYNKRQKLATLCRGFSVCNLDDYELNEKCCP